jgi:hypothetical protein
MAPQSIEVRFARYRLRKSALLLGPAAWLLLLPLACRWFWPQACEESYPLAALCALAAVAATLFAGVGLMWLLAGLFDLLEIGLARYRNRRIHGDGGGSRLRMRWHQFALRDLLAFMLVASLVFAAARVAAPLFSAPAAGATDNWFLAMCGGLIVLLGAHVIRNT